MIVFKSFFAVFLLLVSSSAFADLYKVSVRQIDQGNVSYNEHCDTDVAQCFIYMPLQITDVDAPAQIQVEARLNEDGADLKFNWEGNYFSISDSKWDEYQIFVPYESKLPISLYIPNSSKDQEGSEAVLRYPRQSPVLAKVADLEVSIEKIEP